MTLSYILVFNLGDFVARTSMINDKVKGTNKKQSPKRFCGNPGMSLYSDECHVVEVPNDAKHGKCVKSSDKTTPVNTT